MKILMSTVRKMDETFALRLKMAVLQGAEDQWLEFCRDEKTEAMGYERKYVMAEIASEKQRWRNRVRNDSGVDIWQPLLDDMAGIIDGVDAQVENLRNSIRKRLVGNCSKPWIGTMSHVTATYLMLEIFQQTNELTYGFRTEQMQQLMATIDGIPKKYGIAHEGIHIPYEQVAQFVNNMANIIIRSAQKAQERAKNARREATAPAKVNLCAGLDDIAKMAGFERIR